jgi:chaperonin GroES
MAKHVEVKPLGDRVLIEPVDAKYKEGRTASGIVIPDTAEKERPEQGRIVAAGPGRKGEDGKVIPMGIKKGQIVLFTKYGPNEIKIEGKEYLIAKEEDILAVIE